MASNRSGKTRRVAEEARGSSAAPARRAAVKRARNLSLTDEAIARGEAYGRARGTTLSALVEQFLRGLPEPIDVGNEKLDPAERRRQEIAVVRATTRSPLVRELYGLLAGQELEDEDPRQVHREHLWQKYRGAP